MQKFGFQQPNHTFGLPNNEVYNVIERFALEAERYGFDSFYVMDHLVPISGVDPPEGPILEGSMTIAALTVVARAHQHLRFPQRIQIGWREESIKFVNLHDSCQVTIQT